MSQLFQEMLPSLQKWGQWSGVVLIVLLTLIATQRLMRPSARKNPALRVPHQIFMFALSVVGLVVILISLPIEQGRVGQLVSFFGILLSAAIALSSTNFLGNLMAGLMLRALDNFQLGNFLRCNEHFGRVSERGLFSTEIQTEDGDLTTLPNLFLVNNAVTVVRSDGTILSATCSIGYDVDRVEVEKALLEAAQESGLEDAFVSVMELGDFSIVYRVAGLLREVKQILSRRSRLRKKMLDSLHQAGIEIMSPNILNLRQIDATPLIPAPRRGREEDAGPTPESVIFSKADEAEGLQWMRDMARAVDHELEALKLRLVDETEGADKDRLEARRGRLVLQLERLKREIEEREKKLGGK